MTVKEGSDLRDNYGPDASSTSGVETRIEY